MKDDLVISKKSKTKGEDGHKIFSLRIPDETVAQPEDIAAKTGRSRNEIINLLLKYACNIAGSRNDAVQARARRHTFSMASGFVV